MRPRREATRLGAAAAAVLALGCSGRGGDAASVAQEPPDAGVAPRGSPAPRAGVKVPLPPGWTAQLGADGSFQAGPAGRAVLRVDIRPGAGAQLPDTETLAASVPQQFAQPTADWKWGFAASLDQEEGDARRTLVRVTVAPKLPDGGVGPQWPALVGAKRAGDDLFLCSTLPNVTGDEVRLATEACRDIERQGGK
ncbi:hypothetical protein FGE12_23550 [Aggregicoccus sp. 17bor-14]|nr:MULTISPECIES: hypothetical protein [Myxococcaceae]MBF5045402.1 hypothetical protein [Simulacricoccus sp. 17bor-14]MRI91143.1 hypothetical protein [Aggregicoccus sp. 17bor-14]